MTKLEECRNYNFSQPGIRDQYKVETQSSNAGWATTDVTVLKKVTDTNGAETWETVASYHRNYSMLKTFEPFRQFKNGVWKDYALISVDYTQTSVLDLETGKIIAVESPKLVSKELAEKYPDDFTEGDELRGAGFCPVEFYVPDWWDENTEADKFTGATFKGVTPEFNEKMASDYLDEWGFFHGLWGVYSGCVWGDDSSWKVQYLDLSRIDEGILIADDRFGYVEISNNVSSLREAVHLDAEMGQIEIQVPIRFDALTGKAKHKDYQIELINWE